MKIPRLGWGLKAQMLSELLCELRLRFLLAPIAKRDKHARARSIIKSDVFERGKILHFAGILRQPCPSAHTCPPSENQGRVQEVVLLAAVVGMGTTCPPGVYP